MILGDWIHFYSYLEITPEGPRLKRFLEEKTSAPSQTRG